MNIGDMGVPFIYQGEELIYPEYVKDGLVLHYDFSGMTNNDASKDIARDLSGNGNHGTLQNFNFTPESGYDKNKLLSDGVDDSILVPKNDSLNITEDITLEIVIDSKETTNDWRWFLSTANNAIHESGYSLYQHPTNPYGIAFGYKGQFLKNSEYKVVDLKKYHIAGVSENGTHKLYINGEMVSEETTEKESGIDFRDLRIMRATYYASPHFKGGVGSTRIYNKALTPEEIAHNYAIENERFSIE